MLRNQRAALILGNLEVIAEAHAVPVGTLGFIVRDAPVGEHFVRLPVDDDSQLVNRAVFPPEFFAHRIEII